jgi:hypothetical protein
MRLYQLVRLITAAAVLFFIPTVQAIKYTIIIFLPVPLSKDYFVATNLTNICILFSWCFVSLFYAL